MKNLLLISLTLFTVINSYATETSDQQTKFEMLGDLFQKASKPDLKKIENLAWSGRCFNGFEPDSPYGGVYILTKTATGTYKGGGYASYTEASNYFDDKTFDQIYKFFNSSQILQLNTIKSDATSFYTLDEIKLKITIKMSGKFLLSEFRGENESEEDVLRCYYFKANP